MHTFIILYFIKGLGFVTAWTLASDWLYDGAPSDGSPPWGNRTAENSNPTKDAPVTGVTRHYSLHVARAQLKPDGFARDMIVVNGQFPGPLLEANWGDWFEITVHNDIYGPEEGTLMHWHGLNQYNTPWYDGSSAISHCPITPAHNLTYRFRASTYGTSWYHSHFPAQYTAGVVGPIVIHGPKHVSYDVDLGPILISDWYHQPYQQLVDQVVQGGIGTQSETRPRAVSNLIAGLGVFHSPDINESSDDARGSFAAFDFVPGMTYRLRLVNSGSIGFEQVSIDGHNMTVIANDFVPVEPYNTTTITLGVGQRTDILVTANGDADQAYWFRAWNHVLCGDNVQPDGRAVVYYPNADRRRGPSSTRIDPPSNNACQNDLLSLTHPVYRIPVVEPDLTLTITMTYARNASGSFQWPMNGIAYKGDLNAPVLFDATSGSDVFPAERNVYDLGTNSSIRIVFRNTFFAAHPIHQHGHDFQVLAEGIGEWDGTITNAENPQRRDVQMSRSGAGNAIPNYLVIQYTLDNPGVWLFHCHVAWHLSAGMAVMFLERPEELTSMNVPQDVLDTCQMWSEWQTTHSTDVDDSAR